MWRTLAGVIFVGLLSAGCIAREMPYLPKEKSLSSLSLHTTCDNKVGGYSFDYPSDWKIWKYLPGDYVETSCTSAPADITLSPDIDAIPTQRIDLSVFGADLHPRPSSLNDYLSVASLPSADRISGDTLDNQTAAWFKRRDGTINILCWYNGSVLEIDVTDVESEQLKAILKTFRFD
jgi:hypothetical protein